MHWANRTRGVAADITNDLYRLVSYRPDRRRRTVSHYVPTDASQVVRVCARLRRSLDHRPCGGASGKLYGLDLNDVWAFRRADDVVWMHCSVARWRL